MITADPLWIERQYPTDHCVVLVTQRGWPFGVRWETGHDTTMEALRRLELERLRNHDLSGSYIVRARAR